MAEEPNNCEGGVVAVDTGGTFTDVIAVVDGALCFYKLPSTTDDPSQAVVRGVEHLLDHESTRRRRASLVIHGTTVATNALLERRGARTAMVMTKGFEDLLALGRQNRPQLYELNAHRPSVLIAATMIHGLDERVDATGTALHPLSERALGKLRRWLERHRPESVAVCLLHSYANVDHEVAVGQVLDELGIMRSLSSEVHREFREYERASTTAINAYVMPVMSRYLSRLEAELPTSKLSVMQSNGGKIGASEAGRFPVRTILSGPAGGVVGAAKVADLAGERRIVSFDMGGTSTDVALSDGGFVAASGNQVGGLPIQVQMLDIHTVGAGGGSIAMVDEGGALRVGPQSAGAEPGPICYGRGGCQMTVTDVHLALGHLAPAHFLGGRMVLDTGAVDEPLCELARAADLDPVEAALGVLNVANGTMERALRVMSVERGIDPRELTLVAFGGSGGLHAADLVRCLGFPRALIPAHPGLLSALGMLVADDVAESARTVLVGWDEYDVELRLPVMCQLEAETTEILTMQGVTDSDGQLERLVDLRYHGQSHELTVADGPDAPALFHELHLRRFGHADESRPIEVVTARVRLSVQSNLGEAWFPGEVRQTSAAPESALIAHQPMVFDSGEVTGAVYRRDGLKTGMHLEGPALIVEMSATTLVPPGFSCRLDDGGNLLLEGT